MTAPLRHSSSFPATMEGVSDAAAWLRDVAAQDGLSDTLAFAMEVCLEELGTNVARHSAPAAGADPGLPLTLGLNLIVGEAVEMEIVDNGQPFDVSEAPFRPIRKPLAEVIPGGLGMQLIRDFSDELLYEPMKNGNKVIVKFLRQPEGASKAEV